MGNCSNCEKWKDGYYRVQGENASLSKENKAWAQKASI